MALKEKDKSNDLNKYVICNSGESVDLLSRYSVVHVAIVHVLFCT